MERGLELEQDLLSSDVYLFHAHALFHYLFHTLRKRMTAFIVFTFCY